MSTRKRSRASAAAEAAESVAGGEEASIASANELPPTKKSRRAESNATAKRLAQQMFATESGASPPTQPPAAAAPRPAAAVPAFAAAAASAPSSATKKPATSATRKSRRSLDAQSVLARIEETEQQRQVQEQQQLQAALEKATRKNSPTAAAASVATVAVAATSRPSVAPVAAATPPRPAAGPKTSFQSPLKPAARRTSLPPPAAAAAAPTSASKSKPSALAAPTRATVAATSAVARPAAPAAYRSSSNNNHAIQSAASPSVNKRDDDDSLLHMPNPPSPKEDASQVEEQVKHDGINGFVDTVQGLTKSTTTKLGRYGRYAIPAAAVMSLIAAICVIQLPPPSHEGQSRLQLSTSSTTGKPTNKIQQSASSTTHANDSRPCFETYPPRLIEDDPQDASAVLEYWEPHCSREYYLQEPFVPCPPHAICQGGKIIACDSYFWIPKRRSSTSISKDAATTTNDEMDWPIQCVLSEQAEVFLSSVMHILEGWYVSSSCGRNSAKLPVMRSADGTKYPLVSYNDVLSELEKQGQDQQLQDMLFPDADLFQELAEGRLAMSSTTDEATSTSMLWIGLLPNHVDPRTTSCRTAARLVAFMHLIGSLVFNALRAVVNVILPVVALVLSVVFDMYLISPKMFSIGTVFVLVYTFKIHPWLVRRRAKKQWKDQLESIHRAALHMLQEEAQPIVVLALRDAIREQHLGNGGGAELASIAHFNKKLWPEVQRRLELDQRIGLFLRNHQPTMKWQGPL